MTTTLINNFLNHHPYYNKLTDYQKLTVLNIALTKYYIWKKTEIVHGQMLNGHVGINDDIINNDTIVKLPQLMLDAKSLSKYSQLNVNLSDTDFVKEFTDEERIILYQIALSKVSALIPEEYSIESMTGDIILSKHTNDPDIIIEYKLDKILLKSVYAYKTNNNLDYYLTGQKYTKAFLDLPILKYTILKPLEYTAYMDLPVVLSDNLLKDYYAHSNLISYSYNIRESINDPHVESNIHAYMPVIDLTYSLEHI